MQRVPGSGKAAGGWAFHGEDSALPGSDDSPPDTLRVSVTIPRRIQYSAIRRLPPSLSGDDS